MRVNEVNNRGCKVHIRAPMFIYFDSEHDFLFRLPGHWFVFDRYAEVWLFGLRIIDNSPIDICR